MPDSNMGPLNNEDDKLPKDQPGPKVFTTPITALGCQQCLPLRVVKLKGKHCREPHCRNGVVDTFGPGNFFSYKPRNKH